MSRKHCAPISRRALIAGGLLACGAGLGLRIKEVNDGRVAIPEVVYGLHEWLDLDDCFLGERVSEKDNTGYGFIVSGCSIMSPNEYLAAHARDGVTSLKTDDADRPTVVAVDMKVRNTGPSQGGIKMFLWRMIPTDYPDTSYYIDKELMSHSVPELGGHPGFAVVPGTESKVISYPFVYEGGPDYFHEYEDTYREEIKGKTFRFTLSNLPERRMFVLDAT